jgi:8-oxo-dGTP pyrophosphatase MutT (NUDIX family)
MTDARTFQVARCALTVVAEPWPFAERHKDAIAAHWRKCQIARPKLFDGTIYLTRRFALEHGALAGTLVRTDFKTFLYWRECGGGDDQGVRDGFGAAVIRSAEGYVLLGRQSEGNLNAGLAYPPSGMIDARDVTDGAVDIEASIVRELREETGLEASELARAPGFVVTLCGSIVAIAIEWRSALPAEALRERIVACIRRQDAPELADIVIMRSRAEIGDCPMPPYAETLLRTLLPA